ncbi:MAG: Rieske 2Fe-2S domain-containing protein [Parvularculaceae bacterium]
MNHPFAPDLAVDDVAAPLRGLWYLAALSTELRRGRLARRVLFGEPVVLGRTDAGEPFALRDVCPHRAAPLSAGRIVDGPAVECPYHGWRFRVADGACASVPALCGDGAPDPSSVRVARYSLHEADGLVWLYYDAEGRDSGGAPPAAPSVNLGDDARPRLSTVVEAEGPFDEAALGLVDPAHTPVVHKQWWWRDGAPRREKQKTFEPTALGFRMPAHAPSSNSRIYKMLGGAPTTEIEFRLPAFRLERIENARGTIVSLTNMTPGEVGRTRIVHVVYWTSPLLSALSPLLQRMQNGFLGQDAAILTEQNKNLSRSAHRPLYLGDPDEPSKWYFLLKRAWLRRDAAAPFVNPLAPARLRWRT